MNRPNEAEQFLLDRIRETNWPDNNLCAPPTSAQKCLDVLIDHFLGVDWCVAISESVEQTNTEAVYDILSKYPKHIL